VRLEGREEIVKPEEVGSVLVERDSSLRFAGCLWVEVDLADLWIGCFETIFGGQCGRQLRSIAEMQCCYCIIEDSH
jgi:hypothetical protein